MTTLRLTSDDPAAPDAVAPAVDALLRAPQSPPRLRVELTGEGLPAPLVAALIAGLRRLREVGGAIALEAQSRPVRDAVALHGLDRVFAFPLDPDSLPRPSYRRFVRRAAGAALGLLLTLGFASSARAQSQPFWSTDPATLIARAIDRNPELSSYQGRAHVSLRMLSFPFLREHLDGTTYYKRPANYEVVFDRLPGYARGFQKIYTDAGDPASWDRRFAITYAGAVEYHQHRDAVLHMVQRVRGMIDHETVLVDPDAGAIDQIRYDYYNGGSITLSQDFRELGGYLLLAAQRADIAIPHIRAVALAAYDTYQTNVAVDDAVFQKDAKN